MGARSDCGPAAAKSIVESGSVKARRQISDGWLSDALTTVAAFTMFLGPGIAMNFYIVSVGYYEYRLKSNLLFIMMLFAAYAPFLLVTGSQAIFDAYFDRAFTTHATYPFRIFVGLLLIQALVVVWMYLPATQEVVIGIGFALGASCCVVQASGHQMISAIDPTKLTFSEIGGQIGSLMPIIMISILGFKPSATTREFREFIATVAIVNFSAMVMLLALHMRDSFSKAYRRLAYDLDTDLSDLDEDFEESARRRQLSEYAAERRLSDEPMEASYRAASQATPATPEAPERERSPGERPPREHSKRQRTVPGWVYLWQMTKGFTNAQMAFIVSLSCFYGDPAHTQFLASVKLASDFLGRASALPLVRWEHFGTGPWHRLLVVTTVARVGMVAVMSAQLWYLVLPTPVFVVVWCLFAGLDRMVATLSDVTCGAFVEMKDRKFVSRLTFFATFGGTVLGLGAAACLAASAPSLKARHMEKSDIALLGTDSQGPSRGLYSSGLYHHGHAEGFSESLAGHAFRAAAAHFALQPR